jgi:hypothetical protein
VDEANRLMGMKNLRDLETFLAFCVQVSKQESNCHVVFATSDSLFQRWLESRVHLAYFQTMVLGDLPFLEAYQFYLSEIEKYRIRFPDFPYGRFLERSVDFFERVFHLTGGRMWFISCFIEQVIQEEASIDSPLRFGPICQHLVSFQLLARANDNKEGFQSYSPEDFKYTLQQLTASPTGYVDYGSLLDELGEPKVSELIRSNILYLRPPSNFAYDIAPDCAVLTASSQPALRAMDLFLERY